MATLADKAVGDIVKLNVKGTAKDFIVVHQGLPSSIYDESCDGTWLLMKDCYWKGLWDSSDNDYKNSDIHTQLNDLLNSFDVNMQPAIKQVKIPYVNGTGNGGSVNRGASGLPTKIFLLSGYEVGYTQDHSEFIPRDGARLSYFSSSDKCVAKYDDPSLYGKSAAIWWLRSPYTNKSTEVAWSIDTYGGTDSSGDVRRYPRGVRPAFVLPSHLRVDADGFVIGNQLATITSDTASGSDLGEVSAPFDLTYTINDADGDTVTVTEYVDDVQTRTYTATLGAENTFEAASDPVLFQKILNGQHTLKIVANDTKDDSEPYTVTIDKQVKTAVISLANPLPANDVIKAAVISVTGNIPQDATIEVLVTNNALDENPVWEDMTQDYLKKINHVFANTTAANGFAFNFRVTVMRGASGEQGYIASIGGAFE